jgi:DNA (cytosine-5)-methyltransferase 1
MGLATKRNHHLLEAALASLADAGYFVDVVSVKAEDLGVPQRRRRLLIFARRGKSPFHIELPRTAERTVFDALGTLQNPPGATPKLLAARSKARLIAERIRPGQKLCNVRDSEAAVHTWDIPEVFGAVTATEREVLTVMLKLRRTERTRSFGDADPVSLQRLRAAAGHRADHVLSNLCAKGYVKKIGSKYDLAHTFNGTYRRLRWDAPSPTVDTHFGSPRLFLHPSKHRGLTIQEAAALQGFNADFIWPESKSAAFRLVGNAVPPPISKAAATIVRGLLS